MVNFFFFAGTGVWIWGFVLAKVASLPLKLQTQFNCSSFKICKCKVPPSLIFCTSSFQPKVPTCQSCSSHGPCHLPLVLHHPNQQWCTNSMSATPRSTCVFNFHCWEAPTVLSPFPVVHFHSVPGSSPKKSLPWTPVTYQSPNTMVFCNNWLLKQISQFLGLSWLLLTYLSPLPVIPVVAHWWIVCTLMDCLHLHLLNWIFVDQRCHPDIAGGYEDIAPPRHANFEKKSFKNARDAL